METCHKIPSEICKGRADDPAAKITRKMRFEDGRSLLRKVAVFCLKPRVGISGLRFAWTGKQEDYWRHEYWIRGPRGIADLIIHKDKLIAYYCEEAFKLRHRQP